MDIPVFSGGTLCGYALAGLTELLLPTVLLFLLHRRRQVNWTAVIVGAVIYALTVRLNDISVGMLFRSAPYANRLVIAAETVCIWEECGRWFTARFAMPQADRTRDAVSYGLGHGGAECIRNACIAFGRLKSGVIFNSDGITGLTDGHSDAARERITYQLAEAAKHTFGISLCDMLCCAAAMTFHIALSLLIFRAVRENRVKTLLPCAIFLHDLMNAAGLLASFSESALLRDLAGIAAAAVIIAIVMKLIDGKALLAVWFEEMQYCGTAANYP